MTQPDRNRTKSPWRRPTRRAFVAMLSAAAATFTIREHAGLPQDHKPADPADEDRPRSPFTGTTRWIGHC